MVMSVFFVVDWVFAGQLHLNTLGRAKLKCAVLKYVINNYFAA
jgi:hypothetical protein